MKNLEIKFLFLFLVLVLRTQIAFLSFIDFINTPIKEVKVKVISQYLKNHHYVLKLKNDEVVFYTISRDNLKNLLNENISIKIFTKNISFWGYLTKFFAVSYDLKLLDVNTIDKLIESQHNNKEITNIYKALFLGEGLDYKTRQELSSLGISHLFALSGFHLGIISGVLFFVFSFFYKRFQKFFPYRNRFFDLGVLVLLFEFLYLYVTSFPPSLIRAYVMEVILFLYAIYLKDIFDIKVLVYTILFSFLIFFNKIFSLGFLLSVLGIYYILLYFKYVKFNFLNSLFLSIFLFLMMFVYSHTFFGNFNFYQFLSPLISLVFVVFYPLSILFHLIGMGGIFDNALKWYLSLGDNYIVYKLPFYIGIAFFVLSLIAYYKKWAFYGINLIAILLIGGVFVQI